MPTWLGATLYVTGTVVTYHFALRKYLGEGYATGDATSFAAFLALFWPISAPGLLLGWLFALHLAAVQRATKKRLERKQIRALLDDEFKGSDPD
jgi:hypothetical protein